MTFSEKVRQARKEKGMSQAELARRIGISRATLSRYESGERAQISKPIVMSIATCLGIDYFYLEGYDIVEVDGKQFYTKNGGKTLFQYMPENTAPMFKQVYAELMSEYSEKVKKSEALQEKLVSAFNTLNETGRAEAVKRIEELAQIPKYTDPES